MKNSTTKSPKTFTDRLRILFRGVLEGVGGFLNSMGIPPNVVTIAGLLGNVAAGILIGMGELFWGGLVAMLVGPLDALDGTMARLRGGDSDYGAFIDSVVDRYSEIALFAGLLVHFNDVGNWGDALLVFFAAVGSIMVSYVRARAEALNYSAKIGLLTRAERYIVLIPGVLLNYPRISLWILAVLTNLTALQRFLHVRKQARQQNCNMIKKEALTDD